jgi:hypothetical protein
VEDDENDEDLYVVKVSTPQGQEEVLIAALQADIAVTKYVWWDIRTTR